MKNILISLAFCGLLGWLFSASLHDGTPSPFKFWDNYGFRVGQTVVRTFVDDDPFNSLSRRDTLIVKDIRGGGILFENGQSTRIGSFGMNLYDWKVIK